MPRWRARTDSTHKAVAAALKAIWPTVNARYPADFLCWHPTRGVILVDAKSPGKLNDKTAMQTKLLADGWPIYFVTSAEDVALLRLALMGE